MIVVMKTSCSQGEIDRVVERIQQLGLKTHVSQGVERTIIGILGQVLTNLHQVPHLITFVD